MDEREYLYSLKRQIEDRIDTLEPPAEPPPIPAYLRRLAVVVGHTARSPGAYSKTLGVNEYAFNKDLAARMVAAAEKHSVAVSVFYRDNGGIAGAYATAKAWEPDAIVELHFNAAGPGATGTETIHLPPAEPWARACQRAMVAALGLRDRGVKAPWAGRGEGSLTSGAPIPTVIVEPFFGSNDSDSRLAEERKAALADGLVRAFAEFMT